MRNIRFVIALSIVLVVVAIPKHAHPGVLWDTTINAKNQGIRCL